MYYTKREEACLQCFGTSARYRWVLTPITPTLPKTDSYLCACNKIYRVLHQFHTKVHQLQQQRKIRETRQNQQQLQMSKLQQLLQH